MPTPSPQILIVDDEIDICTNMADIFKELGYHVDVANDGPSAMALVEKSRYDVALLDLMMPGMDGAAVYQEIKRLRPETVAIVITAHPEHPRASVAMNQGAWKLLAKPVDLPQLFQFVEEAVDQPLLLVVDDDPEFCANIWDLLRDRDYRVGLAHDLATAKRLLVEGGEYHLVLLDVRLPDGDGGGVVGIVRELQLRIPIVVITGHQAEFEAGAGKGLSSDVQKVLPKPLNISELLDAVDRFTERRPSERHPSAAAESD